LNSGEASRRAGHFFLEVVLRLCWLVFEALKVVESPIFALVAQGIEHRFPNPKIHVGVDGKSWKLRHFAGFEFVEEQAY
jgi:hypothetical protein